MFVKGKTKSGGRQKGTPNKTTEGFRQIAKDFIEQHKDELHDAWNDIESPENKIKIYLGFMSYVVPKPVAIAEKENEEEESSILKVLHSVN